MQRSDVTGSIAVGKQEDFALLSTDRVGLPMSGSLADRVLNFATQGDIDSIWVGGVLRMRHGNLIGVNMANLERERRETQVRVGQTANSSNIV